VIALRPANAADAEAIAAIYAPHVRSGTVSFETEAPDGATMAARMSSSDGLYPWIVASDGAAAGGVLGYAYATRFSERDAYRWVVETSIYVAATAQRRGIGRLLYAALIGTLRAQGFTQAIGRIALPHDASVALHEALGFRASGVLRAVGYKHGQWIDVEYWQCTLAEPMMPPAEPLPFADVGVVQG
jgi:L-amino acid N-acyltransferase YncA